MDKQSKDGMWADITPVGLQKKNREHGWVFATYTEFSSEREDKCDYKVFLFRNEDRTKYGLIEYRAYPYIDFRKIATRVVEEKEFRESLLSSDPDLPKIWKRH